MKTIYCQIYDKNNLWIQQTWLEIEQPSLKICRYFKDTDITVRPIRQIVRRKEETTGHFVRREWNWGYNPTEVWLCPSWLISSHAFFPAPKRNVKVEHGSPQCTLFTPLRIKCTCKKTKRSTEKQQESVEFWLISSLRLGIKLRIG